MSDEVGRPRAITATPRQLATLLVSSGIRFCEAIGLQPDDFDFDASVLEVARSVVKVSREHHPQAKTFLVRDYTKNGQTRRLKLDRSRLDGVIQPALLDSRRREGAGTAR